MAEDQAGNSLKNGGVEDNAKPETEPVSKDQMLPWEVRRGFLWGFPATVWLFLRHPAKAYRAPSGKDLAHPSMFFLFILIFTIFLQPLIDMAWMEALRGSQNIFVKNIVEMAGLNKWSTYPSGLIRQIGMAAYLAGFIWANFAISAMISRIFVSKEVRKTTDEHVYIIANYALSAYFLTVIPGIGYWLCLVVYIIIYCVGLRVGVGFSIRQSMFIACVSSTVSVFVYPVIFLGYKLT